MRRSRPLLITHSPSDIPREKHGGFALLITITLVAFLVLILVALASLTRVETQVAVQNQTQAQARQNALLALNIALGQLQKHTGPDQRVTARADLILPDSVTVTPPTFNFNAETSVNGGKFTSPGSTGAEVLDDVNAHWADPAAPRNRHWTGAWRNTNRSTYTANNPAAFNPIPGRFLNDDPTQADASPVWLVSGSESATAPDPTTPILGLTATTTALDDTLRDSVNDTPHRLLVGRATTAATAAADLQRYVTAPQLPIRGPAPGLDGEHDIGRYAWWIGDEGIKARADLIDSRGPIAGPVPASPDDLRNLQRRQSAQRPVIEAMTTDGTDGLAPFFADLAADPRLRQLVTPSQLTYLNANPAFEDELGERYHDLSVHSRGVLADTKNGGLRRDLTHILSRPTPSDFRAALTTSGYNVASNGSYNIALSSAATPYATIPNNESSGRAYDAGTGILAASTTWEHLWSFYNMGESSPGGVFSGGVAGARPARADQQALYPLLVQAKLFYGLEVDASGGVTLRITPIAVIANPYNVPLSGDFILNFSRPTPAIVSGTLSDPPPAPDDLTYTGDTTTSAVNQFKRIGSRSLANGGLENISLVIRASSIPPGVAQIFTVDPTADLTIAGPADTREVSMLNTYDPSVSFTYATGLSIDAAAGHTHAALYATGMTPALYMGTTDAENRVGNVVTKSPPSASGAPVESGFLVYPLDSGYHRGGGIFFAIQDGKANPQQAPFYQLNTRALLNDYVGSSSFHDHPLQWGVSYGVRGADGDTDSSPHPLLSANILAPLAESIPATTRWGLVGSGEYPSLNTPPPEITDPATGFVNILYDLPTPEASITSLGQLQHLNLAGHFSTATASNESVKTNSFLVNYPVANSYPAPRVPRHKVFHSSTPFSHHFDASYLWNDLLWDRFTFSSYPPTGGFAFSEDADGHLVNARYRPFRPDTAPDDEASFRGVFEPARNLLVAGAFNINSTSVEAWKALLSALKGVPFGSDASPTAPFARTLSPVGGSANARTGITANAWNGFTDLTQDEINTLAEEMVLQVQLRGPFLSLAEFVNRRLTDGPTSQVNGTSRPDPYRLGLSGALQTAIDRTINHPATAAIPEPYRRSSQRNATTGTRDGTGPFRGLYFADLEYRLPSRIAGYPGYLLQADLLSALGPNLAARSDTFTIRTYGDVRNPATGEIEARAWCEAVAQRLPDYVDATDAAALPAAGSDAETFGRRYQIVSFRWLSPDDI